MSFVGNCHSDPSRLVPADEPRRNLAACEEVGVKHMVAPVGQNPFVVNRPAAPAQTTDSPRQVYADALMAVYELPGVLWAWLAMAIAAPALPALPARGAKEIIGSAQ